MDTCPFSLLSLLRTGFTGPRLPRVLSGVCCPPSPPFLGREVGVENAVNGSMGALTSKPFFSFRRGSHWWKWLVAWWWPPPVARPIPDVTTDEWSSSDDEDLLHTAVRSDVSTNTASTRLSARDYIFDDPW